MPSQLGVLEKTPKAALHEFCRQNEETLITEVVPHKTDPKMYSYIASAFGLDARGSGRSKKEAEHEACANLIGKLANMDGFSKSFQKVPETPRPKSDSDAVMALRNICVQRNWPLPTFELMQSYGQPHSPIFTYVCQLASIKRTGTFSTKKGAKQIATRAMIEAVQHFQQNEEQQQVAINNKEQQQSAEPTLTYHELKESQAKLWAPRIRNRHNFFLQLPKDDRNEAEKILMDNSSDDITKLDMAFTALKLKYDIVDVPTQQPDLKIFHLYGDYDCVIVSKETDLYDRVIDYLKTMLNLQKF